MAISAPPFERSFLTLAALASLTLHSLILSWSPGASQTIHHELFLTSQASGSPVQLTVKEVTVKRVTTQKKPIKKVPKLKKKKPLPQLSKAIETTSALTQNFKEVILKQPAPIYPKIALRKGWEDSVLLKLHIGPQGNVLNIEVLQPASHKIFNESAIAAAKNWNFRTDQNRNEYFVVKEIKFRLRNE